MEDNQINQEETNSEIKNLPEGNTISIKGDEDTNNALKMKAKALLSIKTKRNDENVPEDEKESKKRAVEDNNLNLNENQVPDTVIPCEKVNTEESQQNTNNLPVIENNNTTEHKVNTEEHTEVKETVAVQEVVPTAITQEENPKPKEESSAVQTKPATKKISITEAKKEIDEFTNYIEKIELEIKNKYGINVSEYYYEELLPEELKIKLIEDYFNSEEIIELSKKAAN